MAGDTKARRRLLAFLSQHSAASDTPFGDDKILLTAANQSRLVIAKATFDSSVRDGVLLSRDAIVELTEVGRASAKRTKDDTTDAFAEQQRTSVKRTVTMNDGVRQDVRVNADESPLSRLATRTGRTGKPYIGPDEFEAGERLRRDFERSQLRQRVTASWDIGGSPKRGKGSAGGLADLSDTAVDARTRLQAAFAELGPDLAGVLEDVCCHLKGVETVERERGWPPRSAKLMLRTGLTLLARHYGTTAGAGRGVVRTRHWKV